MFARSLFIDAIKICVYTCCTDDGQDAGLHASSDGQFRYKNSIRYDIEYGHSKQ